MKTTSLYFNSRKTSDLAVITKTFCRETGANPNELVGTKRDEKLAVARHAAIFFCARFTSMKPSEIARHFKRSRSLIKHAIGKTIVRVGTDKRFAEEMAEIEKVISNIIKK